jgi:predicted regulator of Ras-like GTPase activity (Roadblock/LC7/MglB family)
MQVPFLDLYLKFRDKVRALRSHAPVTAVSPAKSTIAVAKPESERLSKTVLPNMTRKVAAPDPVRLPASMTVPPKISIEAAARPRLPTAPTSVWLRKSSGTVSLGEEGKTDRAISIRLGDILDKLPVGCINAQETTDRDRHIVLRASELEKGMSEGKPSVSLASIYQQAPEIFVQRPAADDSTLVALPFEKVLTQFMHLQVRHDQVRDEIVPQVETPILQVTLEDTERFGTTIEPLQTSPLPPVRVEPATAKSIAAAQPEASVSETVQPRALRPAISLRDPPAPRKEPPPPHVPATAPPRPKIPIDLPPNGTGASASEIVPALSGPPVPNLSQPPTPAAPPPRVPFRITPPSEDIRPKFIRIPGSEPREELASETKPLVDKGEERKIALSLLAVLQELPAFQLNGSPEAVPDDARVELPLSLIQPQLAIGRVVVSPTVLQKAIPQDYRNLLKIDPVETPVALPLQEILKNLPAGTLRMRPDQEEAEVGETFETPISIKAAEDAKRFEAGAQAAGKLIERPVNPPQAVLPVEPPAKPAEQPVKPPEPAKAPETAAMEPAAPAKPAEKSVESSAATQKREPQPNEKFDDKVALGRANALPGVAACAIMFADGLALAGKLPGELCVEGLCAMLPSVLQKIDNHLFETKLGPLNALTLYTIKAPLTFIQRGNICLAVLHAETELPAASRDQLVSMTEQLSHTYSEPPPAHVDH